MIKVSIIIVNWNGESILKDCFKSLEKLNFKNWELIIVDNASTDNSLQVIKEFRPKGINFNVIKNKENLGFVGGNNQAVKLAEGKYVLLLNNDTKVPPDLLDVLTAKMEADSKIGVMQPKILIMDNPKYLDNAGSFITKIGFLRHWGFQREDSKEFDKETEIFAAKGACMIIRADIVKEIGLFDPDFFMYFEESDFCWRVWLFGYKIFYYPKTFIYHKVGFSIKRQDVFELNYHYYKNRIASLIKNLDNFNILWIVPLHLVLSLGIAGVFLLRGSFKNPFIILRAIWWNAVNLSKTLKKRSKIQKQRNVTDNFIFERVGRKVSILKLLLFKDSFFKDFKRIEKDIKKSS